MLLKWWLMTSSFSLIFCDPYEFTVVCGMLCCVSWHFLVAEQGAIIQLEVEGSGFLYRQVRNMVIFIFCLKACLKLSLLRVTYSECKNMVIFISCLKVCLKLSLSRVTSSECNWIVVVFDPGAGKDILVLICFPSLIYVAYPYIDAVWPNIFF
jgi:hypothetical protein